MSSRGIIDLRPGSRSRKPLPGQTSLFTTRPSSREPKKPLPLRARRRRTRAAQLFGILAAIAVLGYGIHYLSYLPSLTVEHVVVNGAQDVSPELVGDYAETILDDGSYHFLSRKNLLLYPESEIEKGIVDYFPRVESASVSRPTLFSRTLLVTITERSLFARWCTPPKGADQQMHCYEMDSGGFVYAEADVAAAEFTFSGSLSASSSPIGQRFAPTHLPAIIALLTALGQQGYGTTGANIESDTDLTIPLTKGFLLKASFGASAETLVNNLRIVLSSDALRNNAAALEYVDLRFGDRVYYKLKGQEQVSGQ